MPVDIRISNPEQPGTLVPTKLQEFEQLVRAELLGVVAPSAPTIAARREALRVLLRTKTAVVIEKKASGSPVVTDVEVAGAADVQTYDGFVISYAPSDCLASVDTGGNTWDKVPSGCAFPIDPDEDRVDETPLLYISVFDTAALEARVKSCTFCFPPTRDFEPVGVALMLAQTRTEVLAIEPLGIVGDDLAALPGDREGVRFLAWRGGACCSEVCFRVRFIGDSPIIRAHTWLAPDDPDLQVPPVEPPPGRHCSDHERPPVPLVARLSDADTLALYARTRAQDFALRGARVAAADERARALAKLARYQLFWTQFDSATNPELLAGSQAAESLVRDISIVGAFLQSSYLDRAQRVAEGMPSRDGNPLRGEAAERLLRVAEMTKCELTRDVAGSGPLDACELVEAFEMFAGGQLTVFEAHGAPNGVNYFCFAELAIRTLEICDDPFWEAALPVFARTAELFANSYHMPGGQRRTCAYAVRFNPAGERGYSESERATLAAEWSGLDDEVLVQRYGAIVAAALADELEWEPAGRRAGIVAMLRDHPSVP